MRWKSHVRFLGEGEGVILLPYPTFVFMLDFKLYKINGVIMNLIKFSILVLALTLLCSNLMAIDEKGVKVGFNYSTLTGKNMINSEFMSNYSVGLFLNKRLNNWLVLQPELLISSRGANYDGKERIYLDNDADGFFDEDPFDLLDNDGDGLIDEDRSELDFKVNGHYQLYYLEIPILLKATTEHFISKNLNIIFGPSFNILVDGKYKLRQDGYEYHNGHLSNLNTFDFSAVFGFEYSAGRYRIELRANHSFTENDFKSTGEALMESIENPEDIFGPSIGDDYQSYCKFEKVKGYNTSISLLLGVSF